MCKFLGLCIYEKAILFKITNNTNIEEQNETQIPHKKTIIIHFTNLNNKVLICKWS